MSDGEHVDTDAQIDIQDNLEDLAIHLVDLDDDEAEAIQAVMGELDLTATAVAQSKQRQEIIDKQTELIEAQDKRIELLTAYIADLESDLHECRSIIMSRNQK